MKICIKTQVNQNVTEVKTGFNESLFLKLNPPFPKVKLERFDGSKKGDFVELELDFIISKQTWVSEITFDRTDESVFEFIDIGRRLPFPFTHWQHHHRVISNEKGSLIVDDIEYKCGNALITLVTYPLLLAQFLYRKPVYRKVFR